ncbi:hypothetical protein DXG01_013212 [Tephrocybe rancida]|nr:hypothetical protein DXG01_013212 [Tephrocybe rancida]
MDAPISSKIRTPILTKCPRGNIQRPAGADRLCEVLSNPTFVEFFGKPRPAKDGARQSVFGMDDELKVVLKGWTRHIGQWPQYPRGQVLQCGADKNSETSTSSSVACLLSFTSAFLDSEVLTENFAEKVLEVMGVMHPFVHCLNDMMTVAPDDSEEGTGLGED